MADGKITTWGNEERPLGAFYEDPFYEGCFHNRKVSLGGIAEVDLPPPLPLTRPWHATGSKSDAGKARYDLLAPDALAGLVDILTYGADKYADRNWENGLAYGRVFAAAMRHLWAWWRGEDNDSESGKPHLDHAACCIHFLSAYTKRNMKELDDRAALHTKS